MTGFYYRIKAYLRLLRNNIKFKRDIRNGGGRILGGVNIRI